MDRSDASFVSLLAHPDTASQMVRRVAARAEPAGADSLRFQYVLEADLRHVRIPPPMEAGRADKLWAHTCFEAFVAPPDSARYLELNFSPSGQWAAYVFESYREGMVPAALESAPRLTLQRGDQSLELTAEVQLRGIGPGSVLPAARAATGRGGVRLALSTVVEDQEGRLSYWALRHPPGRPDFHHPESFSLALEFPRIAAS